MRTDTHETQIDDDDDDDDEEEEEAMMMMMMMIYISKNLCDIKITISQHSNAYFHKKYIIKKVKVPVT